MDIIEDPVVDIGAPAAAAEAAAATSNKTSVMDLPEEPIAPGDAKKAEADKDGEQPEAKKPADELPIPKGVQKRIDRAVRQKYEAEARAKMLEERIEAIERQTRQVAQPQQNAQNLEDQEPSIDNFDNFDQYVAAKARWIAKKEVEATLSQHERSRMAESEAAERAKTAESWNKRVAQATAEMPDFEEVLEASEAPMTPPMRQAILESDVGPKLAYYLATHADEAKEIAGLSPIGAIRALGRIEERLAKPTAKQTTNAPPPVKPVGGSASVKKSPGQMSDAEYAKWRKSGRAA